MEYVIETIGLTKQYGTRFGVNELSLHVPKGKIYGLLGRNGAGKTTAMRMILNLIHPTSGRILLFGNDHQKHPGITYRKIGSLIETPGFYENLTGYENLKILDRLRGQHDEKSIFHALKMVELDKETNKVFSNYSLGMKQRLGIAAAIMHDPELLILDEPINGLDPIGVYEIRKFLLALCREKSVTILLSSHILDEIEQLCDIIGVMHEGLLIEEVDMPELRERHQQSVEFTVSDVNAAALILEHQFEISEYTISDNQVVRIHDQTYRRGEINRCFVENGLLVTQISVCVEKLENYFSDLIGGGSIG